MKSNAEMVEEGCAFADKILNRAAAACKTEEISVCAPPEVIAAYIQAAMSSFALAKGQDLIDRAEKAVEDA